ncbi:hypothetical protein EJK49_1226 [Moraxella catarrhalis]|nr:hypothetical protein EJK49_1226 [Moraxella catarrhalis]
MKAWTDWVSLHDRTSRLEMPLCTQRGKGILHDRTGRLENPKIHLHR